MTGEGRPVEIRQGVKVVAYDPSGSLELSDGQRMAADLIVAADGVRSIAHKWVVGEERPAKFSKLTSLRFVVPTETLLNNPGTATLGVDRSRAAVYFGSSNKVGIFQSPCRE